MKPFVLPFIVSLLSFSVDASGGTTDFSSYSTGEQACTGACATHANKPVQLAIVFNQDDRRILNEEERRRFNAVGMIFTSEGMMGTGAVVLQRDIVVTSALLFFEDGKLNHPIDTYSFAISDGSGDWSKRR